MDDERNDIFIHMDKKNISFDPSKYKKIIKKSNLYFTTRISVNWGGFSQIQAELLLLEMAVKNKKYDYFHLISGQDLPIKSQNYIHNFFDKNQGKEFIRFQSENFQYQNRVRYYHLFQENLLRNNKLLNNLNKIFIRVQKLLNIKRNKNINFQKGTNWFSISHDLATYVLEQKSGFSKLFEILFVQMKFFYRLSS